jgi:small multidrug resistance pump
MVACRLSSSFTRQRIVPRDAAEAFLMKGDWLMNWFYLGIAILAEVIGTTALKASDGFTRLMPSLLVAIAYGASFYFLSLTLKAIPVGIAYAVWSGVGLVLIVLAGWWLYGQVIDAAGMVGIGLIAAGVIVLNTLSKTSAH